MNIAILGSQLGMDIRQVTSAKRNPFVAKFLLNILVMVAGLGVFALMLLIGKKAEIDADTYNLITGLVPLIFVSFRALPTATALMNIFRFRKLRKLLARDEELTQSLIAYEEKQDEKYTSDSLVHQETTTPDSAYTSDNNDDKKQVTRADVIKFLRNFYLNQRNASIAITIFAILLFGAMAFIPEAQIISLLLLCISVVGGVTLFIKSVIRLKKTNALRFYIVQSTCINKDYTIDRDNNSVSKRLLYFDRYGKHRINHNHEGMFYGKSSESELYSSVNIGDECYLVMIEGDKKIHMVIPASTNTLSGDEFTPGDNRYEPVRNTTVNDILNEKKKQDFENLSELQLENIRKAEAAISRAKPGTIVLTVLSLVGLAFVVLGAFSQVMSVLNIFLLLPLYIVPLIIAFVNMAKAKKAFDEVFGNFSSYSQLELKYNHIALSALAFLGLDILAYLINFVLIIVIHVS